MRAAASPVREPSRSGKRANLLVVLIVLILMMMAFFFVVVFYKAKRVRLTGSEAGYAQAITISPAEGPSDHPLPRTLSPL